MFVKFSYSYSVVVQALMLDRTCWPTRTIEHDVLVPGGSYFWLWENAGCKQFLYASILCACMLDASLFPKRVVALGATPFGELMHHTACFSYYNSDTMHTRLVQQLLNKRVCILFEVSPLFSLSVRPSVPL